MPLALLAVLLCSVCVLELFTRTSAGNAGGAWLSSTTIAVQVWLRLATIGWHLDGTVTTGPVPMPVPVWANRRRRPTTASVVLVLVLLVYASDKCA